MWISVPFTFKTIKPFVFDILTLTGFRHSGLGKGERIQRAGQRKRVRTIFRAKLTLDALSPVLSRIYNRENTCICCELHWIDSEIRG